MKSNPVSISLYGSHSILYASEVSLMMSLQNREYDIVLLGATGYTGKYCAEYIANHLPTDLKWAVAGRSAGKLSSMLDEIKDWNPDRLQPGLEITSLSPEDLSALVRKTRVLINTVGPYHLYGTPVVEACAKNGTHYVDVYVLNASQPN